MPITYKPIHLVCIGGSIKDLQLMIAKGDDVNVLDYQNHTPLFYACQANKFDFITLLISAGANLQPHEMYGDIEKNYKYVNNVLR